MWLGFLFSFCCLLPGMITTVSLCGFLFFNKAVVTSPVYKLVRQVLNVVTYSGFEMLLVCGVDRCSVNEPHFSARK